VDYAEWEARHALMGELVGSRPLPRVYHYTSLKVLWSVLVHQEFWARHARFSNDGEEVATGRTFLAALRDEDERRRVRGQIDATSPYMICFCLEDDLLSQWREYAIDGVSIGLDFSRLCSPPDDPPEPSFDQLLTVRRACDCKPTDAEPLAKFECTHGECTFARPMPVLYHSSGRVTRAKLRQAKAQASFALDDVEKKAAKLPGSAVDRIESYAALAPYIKDAGFSEESEARLIVSYRNKEIRDKGTRDKGPEDMPIEFWIDDTVLGTKLPCLHIRYGDMTAEPDHCGSVRVDRRVAQAWGQKNHGGSLVRAIKARHPEVRHVYTRRYLVAEPVPTTSDSPLPVRSVHVGPGKDAQTVFGHLEGLLSGLTRGDLGVKDRSEAPALGDMIRVWYDGVWPVRTIRVGPHARCAEIKESIEHFCATHWWLSYVQVEKSRIPYRRPARSS
jgi:hypothetical protein